jgi:putative redox protein
MEGSVAEVVVRSQGGLAQEIAARDHRIRADETVAAGGTDSGPMPYELLLSALGACKAITIELYARRKEWPLETVEVRLTHTKIEPAPDSVPGHRVADQIDVVLKLIGPLDQDQRERIAQIASRCPVHRTLEGSVRITQQLLDQ